MTLILFTTSLIVWGSVVGFLFAVKGERRQSKTMWFLHILKPEFKFYNKNLLKRKKAMYSAAHKMFKYLILFCFYISPWKGFLLLPEAHNCPNKLSEFFQDSTWQDFLCCQGQP